MRRAVSRVLVEVMFIVLAMAAAFSVLAVGMNMANQQTQNLAFSSMTSADRTSYGLFLQSNVNNLGTLNVDVLSAKFYGRVNAYKFHGSEYIEVTNLQVNTASGAYNTVAFMMYWDGTDNVMPMGWDSLYDLYFASGYFGFNTGNGDVIGINSTHLKNSWHFVVAVFYNGVPSPSNVALYIDGVKQPIYQCLGSTTGSRAVTSTLRISGWTANTYYRFKGYINVFMVYNRMLSSDEVLQLTKAVLYKSAPVVSSGLVLWLDESTITELKWYDRSQFKCDGTVYNGLVLYLPFDEGSGSVAHDKSLYHNDGTIYGATWTTGKYGGALSFNGANNYVNRPVVSGLSTNALTFTFWSKQAGTASFFMHPIGIFGYHCATVYVSPNSFQYSYKFETISGVRYEAGIATLDNNWHFFAVVFDGSRLKVYVDNNLKVDISAPGVIDNRDNSVFIGTTGLGSSPAGNWFYGIIDEVRVYNRALTADWIQDLYNDGLNKLNYAFVTKYFSSQYLVKTVDYGGSWVTTPPLLDAEADWVWKTPGAASGAPADSFWIWKKFSLSSSDTIKINITARDYFELYVDGNRVGNGSKWQNNYMFTLPSLSAGEHTLTAFVKSNGGPAGLICSASSSGGFILFHTSEDGTWLVQGFIPSSGSSNVKFDMYNVMWCLPGDDVTIEWTAVGGGKTATAIEKVRIT